MEKDLSKIHGLVTNLFTLPTTASEWEQYRLSDKDIEYFETNGFLTGVPMLDENQRNELLQELDKSQILFHALGAWRISKGFHDVLWNPRLIMAATQLLDNAPVRFWHDQLFVKPPLNGGVVAWHQDYSYWTRTIPMQHLTCWCGLDDADEETGCVQYIPGSHRWGLLPKPALAGNMTAIFECLTDEDQRLQAQKPVFAVTKAGEANFHHPLTLHASNGNRSPDRPRRAFVVNCFRDGVVSNTDDELLAGVPVIPRGRKVEGQFFPLLPFPLS